MRNAAAVKVVLVLAYLAALVIPAFVFFWERGGFAFLAEGAVYSAQVLFPLFGLYAFTLTWLQLLIGSSNPTFKKLWPNFFRFHRAQGLFTLLFALLHPLLLIVGFSFATYWNYEFVSPSLRPVIYLGQTALALLLLTVVCALLMKRPWMRSLWKKVHYANYAVFTLAWLHSWFVGSDTQMGLRWFWLFTAGTAVLAVVFRIARIRNTRATAPVVPATPTPNNTTPPPLR